MDEIRFHSLLVRLGFLMAAGVFIALFFISAPYGRHARSGWGPSISNHWGWFLMEAPAALLFAVYFFSGSVQKNTPVLVFFLAWEAHYIHRGFIYPWMIRDGRKRMPLVIALMGLAFNAGNTYINGRYLFEFSGGYPDSWVTDPRFLTGMALFTAGFVTNRWADAVLRGLRRPGETTYKVPNAGLFRWVSSPNYLGEVVEWAGWAIATWSVPGLAFAVWTFANLAPRAQSNHAWYQRKFPGYPANRKALIPMIW
jgi:3-oxo-5-alpha-steroid 4-dehydrogenase 1